MGVINEGVVDEVACCKTGGFMEWVKERALLESGKMNL